MEIGARNLKDGKLDAVELEEYFRAILTNQACLARALSDVYDAVSRVERLVKASGGGARKVLGG